MRIVQITDYLAYGDAISNHMIALMKGLKRHDITCQIYARNISPLQKNNAEYYNSYREEKDDIILYHFSTGTDLNHEVLNHKCKVILNYHNITPPQFFKGYSRLNFESCKKGYEDAQGFIGKIDSVISDSKYNSLQLKKMGFTCPMYNAPILVDFEQYGQATGVGERKINSAEPVRILFVGRIAPNKCQEKIIRDFYYYNKLHNSNSQLILAGNYQGCEAYYLRLKKYVHMLGLKNVIFTGHIPFIKLLEYYRTSTIFLCESEHEGFCVPLVEAMYFKIPTIAYDSSAIKETLGDAGLIFEKHDPELVCSLIEKILGDQELRMKLETNQVERLNEFNHEKVLSEYMKILGVNCIDEEK